MAAARALGTRSRLMPLLPPGYQGVGTPSASHPPRPKSRPQTRSFKREVVLGSGYHRRLKTLLPPAPMQKRLLPFRQSLGPPNSPSCRPRSPATRMTPRRPTANSWCERRKPTLHDGIRLRRLGRQTRTRRQNTHFSKSCDRTVGKRTAFGRARGIYWL